MARQDKQWKRQMNQGARSWDQESEEKKEQRTLEEFEKEKNG